MDKKETNNALKITTIFGGAQIIIILSGLFRSKVAALLIGPEGVGISVLYNNILSLMSGFLGLGIGLSAIREIAKEENEEGKLRVANLSLRFILLLAIISLLIMVALSYSFSFIQFGNSEYSYGFLCVAVATAFTIMTTGTDAVLKGFRRTKAIALNSLLNAVCSVVTTVILYGIWGKWAIPYAIMVGAIIPFCLSYYQSRDISAKFNKGLSVLNVIERSKPMIILGLMLVISSITTTLVSNTLNLVIRNYGSLVELGLYQAALSISAMSIHLVYVAIANDYYPKLSGCINDLQKMNSAINTQLLVSLLLMAPILAVLSVCSPILIHLFLSTEFMEVSGFIHWIFIGNIFFAVNWCMYYVPLAFGHSKKFMYLEMFNVIMQLVLQIPMYLLWGLNGLSIGMCITFALNALVKYIYVYNIYGVRLAKENIMLLLYLTLLFAILLFAIIYKNTSVYLKIAVVGIVVVFSLYKLNKSSDLFSLLFSKFTNKK